MIVGVLKYRFDFYTYTRTIVNIVPGVEYRKVQDVYSNLNRAARKVNHTFKKDIIQPFDLNNQFQDFGLNQVDLLHFMNGVSYGHTPWVTNFETIVPRLRSLVTRHQGSDPGKVRAPMTALEKGAFEALSGPYCKRLIAWSECGANMQRDLLNDFPDYKETIETKLTIMHPPQEVLVNSFDEKGIGIEGKLRFMMVGAAFLRKGGRELLDTFQRLVRDHRYDIELIIVSSLRIEDYAAKETPDDVQKAKAIIQQNPDWIRYYQSLPNAEVLALMKTAHIGLLPTYADTYGLSVLEFQASGCPVITTDVRALPEINNPDVGWLINVPKNRLGEATFTTPEGRAAISTAISSGLEKSVRDIFYNRQSIITKSNNAIARIRREHDVNVYAERMKQIYRESI